MNISIKAIATSLLGVAVIAFIWTIVGMVMYGNGDESIWNENAIGVIPWALSGILITSGMMISVIFLTILAFIYDDIPSFMDNLIWVSNAVMGLIAMIVFLSSFIALWFNAVASDNPDITMLAISGSGIIGYIALCLFIIDNIIERTRKSNGEAEQ